MSGSGSKNLPSTPKKPAKRRKTLSTKKTTPNLPVDGENGEPLPSTSGTCPDMNMDVAGPSKGSHKKSKRRKIGEDQGIPDLEEFGLDGTWSDSDYIDEDFDNSNKFFDYEADPDFFMEFATEENISFPNHEDEPKPGTSSSPPPKVITAQVPPNQRYEDLSDDSDDDDASKDGRDNEHKYKINLDISQQIVPPYQQDMTPAFRRVMSNTSFQNFRLRKEMVDNMRDSMGITSATILQEKALPVLLKEQDAFICGLPGAGKTISCAISIINYLSLIKPRVCCRDGIRALVIVPTTEFAEQTCEIFKTIAKTTPWVVVGSVGGFNNLSGEREILERGVTVLVGTPLSLMVHFKYTDIIIRNISCVVVDGLDRMLQRGDERNLSDIILTLERGLDFVRHPDCLRVYKTEHVETMRQTILITTLVLPPMLQFAALNMTDPVFLDDSDDSPPRPLSLSVANVEKNDEAEVKLASMPTQYYMIVPEKMRLVALIGFILSKFKVESKKKIIVYVGTQIMADYYRNLLGLASRNFNDGIKDEDRYYRLTGINFYHLTHKMETEEKMSILLDFGLSEHAVLFCTDLSVKGVIMPRSDWIIHFTPPTCTQEHVNRIKTAGLSFEPGLTVAFLLPSEGKYVKLAKAHKIPIKPMGFKHCLKQLWNLYKPPHNVDSLMTKIQLHMQSVVYDLHHLREQAYLAFFSCHEFYGSYPDNMKKIFHTQFVNMNEYAYGFALDEPAVYLLIKGKSLLINVRRESIVKKLDQMWGREPVKKRPENPPKGTSETETETETERVSAPGTRPGTSTTGTQTPKATTSTQTPSTPPSRGPAPFPDCRVMLSYVRFLRRKREYEEHKLRLVRSKALLPIFPPPDRPM